MTKTKSTSTNSVRKPLLSRRLVGNLPTNKTPRITNATTPVSELLTTIKDLEEQLALWTELANSAIEKATQDQVKIEELENKSLILLKEARKRTDFPHIDEEFIATHPDVFFEVVRGEFFADRNQICWIELSIGCVLTWDNGVVFDGTTFVGFDKNLQVYTKSANLKDRETCFKIDKIVYNL